MWVKLWVTPGKNVFIKPVYAPFYYAGVKITVEAILQNHSQ